MLKRFLAPPEMTFLVVFVQTRNSFERYKNCLQGEIIVKKPAFSLII